MDKSPSQIFKIRLKKIMKRSKITNADIAKAMDKDKQVMTNYFNGTNKAAWTDTCNLIAYLQKRLGTIDLNSLFGNTEENDLLITISHLSKELKAIKKAYADLAIEYVLLNNKIKKLSKKGA